jgi:CRP/FNR family cyclic AMP-dependent transcriptional regulator
MSATFDPKAFLTGAAEGGTVKTYRDREVIFGQGDPADAVFYLMAGRIKRTVVSNEGKEAVVALLGPGEFFGEGCLSGKTHRTTAAIAMEECTIARLEKPVLVRVLHEQVTFAGMFIAYLLSRNQRIEADLVDQLFNPSEKRLARVLLNLADFDDQEKAEAILPKISQETLAEMIGTTRSRISFFMNKFRRLGFIDYNGHLTVKRSLMNVILRD